MTFPHPIRFRDGLVVLVSIATLLNAGVVSAFSIAPTMTRPTALAMSATAEHTAVSSVPSHVAAALKKASKTLTVHLEYAGGETLDAGELGTLSMQARKLQVNSLWVSDVQVAHELVQEQASAKGNFPGPCPVIYDNRASVSTDDLLQQAVQAGVDAVVVPASAEFKAPENDEVGVIYLVQSEQEVQDVLARADNDQSVCFLVDANNDNDNLDSILSAVNNHKNSIVLAAMPAMQHDNAEISTGKTLKQQHGVHGIVLERALMGDAEDIEYCTFAVQGLTKKQSSTFNMSGLTGSTNGHFGGVSSSVAKTWRRTSRN
ncbi:expressed unknown protein [Seminavis robusta]|uniref:Uncharacterized protein n=1 Tax=Seminavis robusta TaxID=568900 RepID=A0A9N8HRM4_9STRA|nr:expressed unknown protein [Seminavis robusta]|eukprot:Sro1414_g270660.1 n/a (317) ;mRNA; r:15003-15953